MSMPPRVEGAYGSYGGGPGSYPPPRGGGFPDDRLMEYGGRSAGYAEPYMGGMGSSVGWEDRRAPLTNPMGGGGAFPPAIAYDMYGGSLPPPPLPGGRRSPEWDDRRNKRRRSISPRRDMYYDQGPLPPREWEARGGNGDYRHGLPPRDDYYGVRNGDSYGGHPPAFVGASQGHISHNNGRRNGMDPPDSLPYQVTFRYFTDWMRLTDPATADSKDGLETAWKSYRLDYLRKGHLSFFKEWKGSPWFREKYDPSPEFDEIRALLRRKGRAEKIRGFVIDLHSDLYDDFSLDETESDHTTVAAVAQNGAGVPTVSLTDDSEIATTEGKETGADQPVEGENQTEEKINGVADEATPIRKKPSVQIPPNPSQLFIKSIPPEFTRMQIEEKCKEAFPEEFDYLILSEPNPFKKWHRVGWVNFVEETDMEKVVETLAETQIENFTLHMKRVDQPVQGRIKFAPAIVSTPERVRQDFVKALDIACAFEKQEEGHQTIPSDTRIGSTAIQEVHESLADSLADEERQRVANKKGLDLLLEYLRVAFNTCYYCAASFDTPENLDRWCTVHKRKQLAASNGTDEKEREKDRSKTKANDTAWLRTLDEKLSLLGDTDKIDPRDYGGESYEEEMHKLCHPRIKYEDEGKFRCKECNKLFSALKFIEKHLLSKHAELFAGAGPDGDVLHRVQYLNNYVMDPNHLPHPGQDKEGRGENGGQLSDRIGDRDADGRPLHNKRRRGHEGFAEGGRGGGGGHRRDRLPPPPPEGAVLDPRARKGASSYADLDGAPAGDVILNY